MKILLENVCAAKKCFTLLKKTFNIDAAMTVRERNGSRTHRLYILQVQEKAVQELLEAIKYPTIYGRDQDAPVDDLILQKNCCKRAFVRGCFLASGSVTDPAKSYHLEIICPTEEKARQLCGCINSFWREDEEAAQAKTLTRAKTDGRRSFVVYVKEGNQISDLLNICETYRCLMEMENVRVEKEIANTVNRKLNCEMANMVKTITAAQEQKNDILYIEEHMGLEQLPEELSQLARIRLEDTEMSLKELGEQLIPPIGKSGVNHRLRKIKKIADDLREGKLPS
jgi:hypothetical protein